MLKQEDLNSRMGMPAPERFNHEEKPLEVETNSAKNVIFIVGGKLGLEAIGNKILILIDKFRSGYECKDCEETGIFKSCECERKGTPGRYISGNVNRECRYCNGTYETRRGETCVSCKGTGSTVVMPENARAIPTSGVIVSIGPECTTRNIGERVLFGSHTGYYLPFKGNAKIRCMREDEPLCKIYAVDNTTVMEAFLSVEEEPRD